MFKDSDKEDRTALRREKKSGRPASRKKSVEVEPVTESDDEVDEASKDEDEEDAARSVEDSGDST